MRTSILALRVPTLALLLGSLASCGDDGPTPTQNDTSSEDGSSTNDPSTNDPSTSAPGESSVDPDSSGSADVTSSSGGVDSSDESSSGTSAELLVVDDAYDTRMDAVRVVSANAGLLANDTGNAIVVLAQLAAPTTAGGTIAVQSNGAFTYTPPVNWWGEDSFEYTAIDVLGQEAVGSVRLVVAPTTIPLSVIAGGFGGIALDGDVGEQSGWSVDGSGDVDGDGIADLLIAAPGAAPNGSGSGRVYVVFGGALTETIDLAAIAEGVGGFAIDGGGPNYGVGETVSTAGDVDGDGLDDILVGADLYQFGGPTFDRHYLVFGKADGERVNVDDVTAGIGGFAIDDAQAGGSSRRLVQDAGDVNGDGLADLIVSADSSGAPGLAHVVFGKADTAAVNLGNIVAGIGGFAIHGIGLYDGTENVVSGAGDVNADGLDDLIVGVHRTDLQKGSSYVVFGKPDSAGVSLAAVAQGIGGYVIEGAISGDRSGYSVSGAGDVDGDGRDDVIIGGPGVRPSGIAAGRSYVVFGQDESAVVELSDVGVGIGGFAIDGELAGDSSGWSVASAGDVDGDGLADVLVRAFENGEAPGRVYVVFGKTDTTEVELADVALGDGGFRLTGEPMDGFFSGALGRAGDFDGDGYDDVIIGSRAALEGAGRSYLVHGGPVSVE